MVYKFTMIISSFQSDIQSYISAKSYNFSYSFELKLWQLGSGLKRKVYSYLPMHIGQLRTVNTWSSYKKSEIEVIVKSPDIEILLIV